MEYWDHITGRRKDMEGGAAEKLNVYNAQTVCAQKKSGVTGLVCVTRGPIGCGFHWTNTVVQHSLYTAAMYVSYPVNASRQHVRNQRELMAKKVSHGPVSC